MNDSKIINDPIFGFIKIPHGLLLDIVEHPLMQRLTRIKQLGLTSMVYPSAQHTRFQHSIGAFHLMSEAITSLTQKGIYIFDSEAEAVEAAILMHDIGHGPFSHVLEHTLISGISHEEISLLMMEQINKEMKGELNLALKIFKNEYPKKFLHQLISSQLDMDRLDYLRRDSFYTGVSEGNIGSARIIKMLDVHNDNLVVNSKGLYSIENYLMARRLMYWQVYLHKTTVSSEKVLVNALLRAKRLAHEGKEIFATPCLRYFLYNDIDAETFRNDRQAQLYYTKLDDSDILSSLKVWTDSNDKVLSILSTDIINRNIFKVEIFENPVDDAYAESKKRTIANMFKISLEEAGYLMSIDTIQKDMYDVNEDQITILFKDNTTKDISESSELLNIALLSKKIRKYYLCYQRF
jgi:HD superfamily phosphohydrolase